MNTISIACKHSTKIIAHRGLSGLECENTLPAFIAAGSRTYWGVECDVHVTSDGKYVVMHDDSTARMCTVDCIIENTDFSTLRSLEFRNADAVIPTLDEYLAVIKEYNKTAVVELKNHMEEGDIKNIVSACLGCLPPEKLVIISFDFENLVTVRRLFPAQRVQYLTGEWEEGLPDKLVQNGFDLDIHYSFLTKERISLLHSRGISVNCWTCDDPSVAARLAEDGVDFITTNILE